MNDKGVLLANVLTAIDAMIAAELAGGREPGRYKRILQLCVQAHKLEQMAVTRVAAIDRPENPNEFMAHQIDHELNDEIAEHGGLRLPNLGPLAFPPVPIHRQPLADMADVFREIMIKTTEITNRKLAPPPTSPLEDLHSLIALKADMEFLDRADRKHGDALAIIDRKINRALAQLDKETTDATDSDLVPAQLLRGHPADQGRDQRHQGRDRGANGSGAPGADDAGGAGEEEGVEDPLPEGGRRDH